MTWQTGTAASHIEVLNAIRDIATSRNVSVAVVDTVGSGYVVGDVLSVAGGTSTYTATIEVLTVNGGGGVTSARIATGGAYTVDPTTANNAVTGGSGSGALFDLTMADTGWTIERETQEVDSVAVNAGGAGYVVSDTLTLVGGLGIGSSTQVSAATFNVDSVDGGGAITGISVNSGTGAGVYEEPLSSLTGVSVTGGSGSGATVDVTFAALDDRDKWLVMSGAAGGAGDEATIAFRSYQTTADGGGNAANLAVFGIETFNPALLMEGQNNLSPGIDGSGDIDTTQGAFVPLVELAGASMSFWFSITDRRVLGYVKCTQGLTVHYPSFHAGFLNQYGTAVEKPYPVFLCGSTPRYNTRFNEVAPSNISGVLECFGTGSENGPGWLRRSSDGVWQLTRNGVLTETTGSRQARTTCIVYPMGEIAPSGSQTGWDAIAIESQLSFENIVSLTTSAPTKQLIPTPNTGGDLRLRIPATVVLADFSGGRFEIAGEIDGLFWFSFVDPSNLGSAEGVSEDFSREGSDVYRIFQSGNRTEQFSYTAVLEA